MVVFLDDDDDDDGKKKRLEWWGNERGSYGELHENQQGRKTYHEWDEDDAHIDDWGQLILQFGLSVSPDNSASDLSFYAVCNLGPTAGMNRALLSLQFLQIHWRFTPVQYVYIPLYVPRGKVARTWNCPHSCLASKFGFV